MSMMRGDCQIGAGLSITRPAALDAEERVLRDERARRVLAGYALAEPDPAGWLGEMLDALGLRPGAEPIEERT